MTVSPGELATLETLFNRLLEKDCSPKVIITTAGEFIFANRSFRQQFALDTEARPMIMEMFPEVDLEFLQQISSLQGDESIERIIALPAIMGFPREQTLNCQLLTYQGHQLILGTICPTEEQNILSENYAGVMKMMFDNATYGLSVYTKDFRLLTRNAKWEEIWQTEPVEGPRPLDLLWDEYSPTVRETIEDILTHGGGIEIPDFEVKHPVNGKKCWITQRILVRASRPGETARIVIGTEDVTERKTVEQALRADELRWQYALEAIGDGIWDWNCETGDFFASARYREMLGYDLDEEVDFRGRWEENIHPEDRERVLREALQHRSGETPTYASEYRLRRKDGQYIWILDRGRVISRGINGQALRLVGTHTDITERKEMESRLQESEKRYRMIFESAGIPLIFVEENTTLALVNHEFETTFGYSKEEVEGKVSFDILVEPCEIERLQTYHRQRRIDSTLVPRSYETRCCTKSGEMRICSISVTYIPETKQSLAALLDVTGVRQAEAALKNSETLYRTLFENTGNASLLIGEDTTVLLANSEYARLIGLTKEEIEGKHSWQDYIHPDDRERMVGYHYARRKDPSLAPRKYEFRTVDIHGQIKDCICFVIMIPGTRQSIASMLDITELKIVEKELQQREHLFRSYFELPLVGIAITAKHRFIRCNPKLCEILNYTEDELLQLDWESVTEPEDIPIEKQYYAEFETNQRSQGTHYKRYRRKDGQIIYARVSSIASHNPDGSIEHIISLIEDITLQKQAEEENQRLETQLRQSQKMEAIGTLAGGIAHDFNNILTSIYGFVELTMMVLPETSLAYENLDHVLRGLKRARDLINQILTFSRQTEQELRPLSIAPVVKETLKLLRASLPSTIEIDTRIEPELCDVMGDPTQIQQVIMNLCTNANHAMKDAGGKLTVAVEAVKIDPAQIEQLNLSETATYICVSVRDNGCGMDKHTRERVFDPFFTTKSQGEGTGLGLSIVHGIISAHHGAITVESEVGVGTIFKVYLPCCADATPREIGTTNSTLPIGFGRILLVDDEKEIVQMTRQMLELLGYEVESFIDSREALHRFIQSPGDFDLVITDYTMPGMTGSELSREIHATRSELPILLTTGFSEVLSPEAREQYGIVKCLTKPFDVWMLGNTISSILHHTNDSPQGE